MSFDLVAQKAIYSNLTANTGLVDFIGGRIYDFVPQKAVFPFVSIGEDALTEHDTSVNDGTMLLATIHTWSNGIGRKECKEIQELMRSSLHKSVMVEAGYTIHFCHWQGSQSFIDSDGITRHGVCTYNFYITED